MKVIAIKIIKILLCIVTLFLFAAAGLVCFAYIKNPTVAAVTSTLLWCSGIAISDKI